MSNIIEDRNIKNRVYYFFDDIVNIKEFDPSNIKLDENSYKNILIHYIAYVAFKHWKYVKINSVNPLYLMFNRANGYFEEINGNKYLKLVFANQNKENITEYEELRIWISNLIRSVTIQSDDYDKKYMQIKFNSDDELPLNKTI